MDYKMHKYIDYLILPTWTLQAGSDKHDATKSDAIAAGASETEAPKSWRLLHLVHNQDVSDTFWPILI